MNEIIIEDKKYISSKQAAELTGYAKDYVGQLCREGRVPARLIGRNWYVLKSAIEDHRFGAEEAAVPTKEKPAESARIDNTWEQPRYAAAEPDIPGINRLSAQPQERGVAPAEEISTVWEEWFSKAEERSSAPVEPVGKSEAQESQDSQEETDEAENSGNPELIEETTVPIRAIEYRAPLIDSVSAAASEEAEAVIPESRTEQPLERRPHARREAMVWPRMISIGIAAIALAIVALNAGYFDNFVGSYSQASVLSGISIYNK